MSQDSTNFVSYIETRIQSNNTLYSRFHIGNFSTGQALTIAKRIERSFKSEFKTFIPQKKFQATRTVSNVENRKCFYCKKPGHLIKDCKLRMRKNKQTSHCSSDNSSSSTTSESPSVFQVNGPLVANAKIQDMNCDVLVDTGAELSLMDYSFAKRLRCDIVPDVSIPLRTANDGAISIVGKTRIRMQFETFGLEVTFRVVDYLARPLVIGLDTLTV